MLAVALMGWRLLVLRRAPAPAAAKAAAAGSTPAPASGATAMPATASPLPASTAAIPEKSVAALPFANESGNADEQFFSDGLSDGLITALSQVVGLKVISRNSAFQFRDSKDSSAKIGTLLGVAHLLEGSVQREDNQGRITATLVNAADGTVLWTQRYDKPYKDVFALQDAITKSVAEALQAKLLTAPGAVVQSDRPPGGSLAAYTAYQHGLADVALGTEASVHQAIDAFNAAIHLDPRYAAAYAQLGLAWNSLAIQFLGGTLAAVANAKARAAIAIALKLDPDSSLAHQARSTLLQNVDFDWAGAAAEARRALQLSPQRCGGAIPVGRCTGHTGAGATGGGADPAGAARRPAP